MISKGELMDYLEKEEIDVLATFGAGDVDRFIEPISRLLEERN